MEEGSGGACAGHYVDAKGERHMIQLRSVSAQRLAECLGKQVTGGAVLSVSPQTGMRGRPLAWPDVLQLEQHCVHHSADPLCDTMV